MNLKDYLKSKWENDWLAIHLKELDEGDLKDLAEMIKRWSFLYRLKEHTPRPEKLAYQNIILGAVHNFPRQISKVTNKYLRDSKKNWIAVDFMCGLGLSSLALTKYTHKGVLGIDQNENFVGLSKEVFKDVESLSKNYYVFRKKETPINMVKKIKWRCEIEHVPNLLETGLEDNEFDFAVCQHRDLEIIDKKDLSKLFEEMARVSKFVLLPIGYGEPGTEIRDTLIEPNYKILFEEVHSMRDIREDLVGKRGMVSMGDRVHFPHKYKGYRIITFRKK